MDLKNVSTQELTRELFSRYNPIDDGKLKSLLKKAVDVSDDLDMSVDTVVNEMNDLNDHFAKLRAELNNVVRALDIKNTTF